MSNEWFNVSSLLPKEGALVEWTTPTGDISRGRRHGRLWFVSDDMYVYYTPVKWRYVNDDVLASHYGS